LIHAIEPSHSFTQVDGLVSDAAAAAADAVAAGAAAVAALVDALRAQATSLQALAHSQSAQAGAADKALQQWQATAVDCLQGEWRYLTLGACNTI
jgi:hypothetical protein